MALTLALLGSAARAGAASPKVTVAPPIAVAESVLEPSLGWTPALASSGDSMLVAYLANVAATQLVGRLLDSDGTPLGLPFVVAEEAHRDAAPSVVFDGEQYIVSWQLESGALYHRRVDRAGEPLAAAELVDATVSGSPGYAVAAGEAGVLFITCGYEECSSRLLASGQLGAAQSFPTLGTAGHVSLAHSDGAWLVALGYVSGGGRLVQLSAIGAELADTRHDIDIADAYNAPHVAPAPDGFVVAWVPEDQMQLARVDFDGELTLAPLWTNEMQRPKALHATGTELVLYAAQRDDCEGCGFVDRILRVDAALAPLGNALPLSGFGDIATTASGSPHFFAYDEVGHIAGARVELTAGGLSIGAAQPWSVGAADQYLPRGAPTRDGWLLAWHEDPPSFEQPHRVRASFLSAMGTSQGSLFVFGAERARLMDVACTWDGCMLALAEDPGFQIEPLRGSLFRINHGSAVVAELPGEWTDNVALAASEHSLLMATVQEAGRELLLRLHDDAGALMGELALTPLKTNAFLTRPLPLAVKLDGQEFVVVWYDQSQVWSFRVPVMGPLAPAPAQLLFSEQELELLDVAFSGSDWWASSLTQVGGSWRASDREPQPLDQPISSLVSTHGVALATFGGLTDQNLGLAMAGPGEDWTELSRFDGYRAHLSAPHDGKVLLSSSRRDSWTVPVWRVEARVVAVEDETGAGGASGEGGRDGVAGMPGEGGAGSASVMGDAGAASEPTGDGGSAEAPARRARHSRGCGCRAPGGSASSGAAWLLVLAGLLARARSASARREGRKTNPWQRRSRPRNRRGKAGPACA